MAGVEFFSPPSFCHQEPRGDQRERLMMVPAAPVTNLVVGQSRFALAPLDTLLDPMLCLGDPREFDQRRLDRGVGQVVVGLDDLLFVAIPVADHHQDFGMAGSALGRAPHHAPLDDLDDQGPFFAVADIDLGPTYLITVPRGAGVKRAAIGGGVGATPEGQVSAAEL